MSATENVVALDLNDPTPVHEMSDEDISAMLKKLSHATSHTVSLKSALACEPSPKVKRTLSKAKKTLNILDLL